MLIDIGKFLLIFFLVLISFACGLNQLYYYYTGPEFVVPTRVMNITNVTGSRAWPTGSGAITTARLLATSNDAGGSAAATHAATVADEDNHYTNPFDP
jgi:hypothetical protein